MIGEREGDGKEKEEEEEIITMLLQHFKNILSFIFSSFYTTRQHPFP